VVVTLVNHELFWSPNFLLRMHENAMFVAPTW